MITIWISLCRTGGNGARTKPFISIVSPIARTMALDNEHIQEAGVHEVTPDPYSVINRKDSFL